MAFDADPTVTRTGPRRIVLTLEKIDATSPPEPSMRIEIGASDGSLWGGKPRFPTVAQIQSVLTAQERQALVSIMQKFWDAAVSTWPPQ